MLTLRDLPTLVAFFFSFVLLIATLRLKSDLDKAQGALERVKKALQPPIKEPSNGAGGVIIFLIFAAIGEGLLGCRHILMLLEFIQLLSNSSAPF